MKIKISLILALLSFIFLISCNNDDIEIPGQEALLGNTWRLDSVAIFSSMSVEYNEDTAASLQGEVLTVYFDEDFSFDVNYSSMYAEGSLFLSNFNQVQAEWARQENPEQLNSEWFSDFIRRFRSLTRFSIQEDQLSLFFNSDRAVLHFTKQQ